MTDRNRLPREAVSSFPRKKPRPLLNAAPPEGKEVYTRSRRLGTLTGHFPAMLRMVHYSTQKQWFSMACFYCPLRYASGTVTMPSAFLCSRCTQLRS